MYVIQHKTTKAYMTGGRTTWSVGWTTDINKARVFSRKCDASNSITGHFGSTYGYYRRSSTTKKEDVQVIEVKVSVSTENTPQLNITPEILDRATRFMMIEQAAEGGAPQSLRDSFKDLTTEELVKLVTTLYGK